MKRFNFVTYLFLVSGVLRRRKHIIAKNTLLPLRHPKVMIFSKWKIKNSNRHSTFVEIGYCKALFLTSQKAQKTKIQNISDKFMSEITSLSFCQTKRTCLLVSNCLMSIGFISGTKIL